MGTHRAATTRRIVTDGWTEPTDGKAIAIDRETVVMVEPSGRATILANPGHKTPYAWFMRTPGLPEVWSGTGGLAYTLGAEAGALTSSRGAIY